MIIGAAYARERPHTGTAGHLGGVGVAVLRSFWGGSTVIIYLIHIYIYIIYMYTYIDFKHVTDSSAAQALE